MRAATERGIALCIGNLLDRKSSNAIMDVEKGSGVRKSALFF
jgi:hypothetical protein